MSEDRKPTGAEMWAVLGVVVGSWASISLLIWLVTLLIWPTVEHIDEHGLRSVIERLREGAPHE